MSDREINTQAVQELLDELDPHKGMSWFRERLWSALMVWWTPTFSW
jgi:hypothetical protein